MVLARASILLALLMLALAVPAHADDFSDAQAALEQAAQQVGSSVGVPKATGQKSWTESAAQNGGVAAPTAPATPTTAEPAPDAAAPAPAPTAAAPAPTAVAPAPANVNITIRVKSPGNDGPTVQQVVDGGMTSADADRIEHDLQVQLDKKLKELQRQVSAAPAPVQSLPVSHPVRAPVRHHVVKPKPAHAARAAHHVVPLRIAALPHATPPPRPASHKAQQRRSHAQRGAHHPHAPFQQLPQPFPDQAMSAGSSGGSSTPPPALFAVLLAAACFGASMLLTSLWDAHRRRRSRLFASRLERPG